MTTQLERTLQTELGPLTQPTFVPIWLACNACGYWWDDWQPNNCRIAVWVAHVGTYHCPHCDADNRKLALRTTPLSERPRHV